MTGRYPMRCGLQWGVVKPYAQYGLPLAERTLPQALREAGYATAIVGKWHLGHHDRAFLPTARGFDHQYGHYNGAIDYYTHERDGGLDWHRDDHALREEGYSTQLIASEAVRLIRERDKAKPLFLYVPFNAVHAPLMAPEKYFAPYAALPEPRRTFAGMVAVMDECVGQIVAALDGEKMRADTLIIFSSDNGGNAPGKVSDNTPLRGGKHTLYEGGVRVPAFAVWPGKIKPSVVNAPLHMVDWFPTLLALAGASAGELDGADAWKTIAEGTPSPHEFILHNAAPKTGALRAGDWKFILNGHIPDSGGEDEDKPKKQKPDGPEQVELFNIADDPSETKNLAETNPEKLRELRARYDALAAQAVPVQQTAKPKDFVVPAVWGEVPAKDAKDTK